MQRKMKTKIIIRMKNNYMQKKKLGHYLMFKSCAVNLSEQEYEGVSIPQISHLQGV